MYNQIKNLRKLPKKTTTTTTKWRHLPFPSSAPPPTESSWAPLSPRAQTLAQITMLTTPMASGTPPKNKSDTSVMTLLIIPLPNKFPHTIAGSSQRQTMVVKDSDTQQIHGIESNNASGWALTNKASKSDLTGVVNSPSSSSARPSDPMTATKMLAKLIRPNSSSKRLLQSLWITTIPRQSPLSNPSGALVAKTLLTHSSQVIWT